MRYAALALPLLLTASVALTGQEPTSGELLRAVERQLQAAHAGAGPSVACVVVSRSDQYPAKPGGDTPGRLGGFDPKQYLKDNPQAKPAVANALDLSDVRTISDHGFACGVVVDEKGLILTPYHVVDGATKVYVHLPGHAGSYADIHAADARTDLAVLRLLDPPPGLRAIKFADVKLPTDRARPTVAPGKLAVLMANAFVPGVRLNRPSAALGSVTNVHSSLNLAGGKEVQRSTSYYYYNALLEHDAKLNAGISGAALLNLDGELIGLTTTAPVLSQGEKAPDYALPMDDRLQRIVAVLCRGEEVEAGYLGVQIPNGPDALPNMAPNGVAISWVLPLGPLALAGVRDRDTITHINGARIRRYEELLTHISGALAGSKVTITTAQAGEVTVTLGKLQHGQPFIASARPAAVFGLRVDHGSMLAQLAQNNANPQILSEGVPPGVTIQEVAADSPAAAAFKKIDDQKLSDVSKRWLITHVNGAAVATPREFYAAAKDQKSVKLTLIDPTEARAARKAREVTLP